MKKLMLLTALAVLVVGQAWAQGAGTGASLRGSYCFNDKTGQMVDCTTGEVLVRDVTDATYGDLKSTGLSALTVASGSTYTSDLVDLSQYRYAALIMTWGTAAASDSSNIGFGVRLFNKQTGAWGSDDSAIESRIAPFFTGTAATDTAAANLLVVPNTGTTAPTFYVYRSATAPIATTYTLTMLSKVPRYHAFNGSLVVDLTAFCNNWNYWGMQITNVNSVAMTNFKAVLWVSR